MLSPPVSLTLDRRKRLLKKLRHFRQTILLAECRQMFVPSDRFDADRSGEFVQADGAEPERMPGGLGSKRPQTCENIFPPGPGAHQRWRA